MKFCSVYKYCIVILLTSLTSCELDIQPFGDPTPCDEKTEYPLAKIYGWVIDACTGKGVSGVSLSISAICKYSPCGSLTTRQAVSSATTDSTGYFIFIEDKRSGLYGNRVCPNGNFDVAVTAPDGYKTQLTHPGSIFTGRPKWSAGEHNLIIYPTGVLILDLVSDSTKSNAEIEFIHVGTRLKMGNMYFSEWLHVKQPCPEDHCVSCDSSHCVFIDSWKNVTHYVRISYARDGIQNHFSSNYFFIGCEDTTYQRIIF